MKGGGCFTFEGFVLDAADRRLTRDGAPVELNGRYFDALALLVAEQGRLVSKDRFLEEVWQGAPVTDEALTQCIRTLRRRLGDSARRPRFIETAPKQGYRFIAPVTAAEPAAGDPARLAPRSAARWSAVALEGGAGALGGGLAGVFGGLLYSVVTAAQPAEPGIGAASSLLVLICLTVLVGLAGGAGVGFGVAATALMSHRRAVAHILGGAAGGLLVGAIVKMAAVDAFSLLFGRSPGDITGALEGAALGAAAGFGVWLTGRRPAGRGVGAAALAGAGVGIVIHITGGRLMAGSLDLVAREFPESRLRLDQLGALFGEDGFGPVSQAVATGLEGLLFAAGVVAAMAYARERLGRAARRP